MSESATSALDVNGAANVFASMLEPQQEAPEKSEDAADNQPEAQANDDPPAIEDSSDADESSSEEPKTFTIKVDGKDVEVTESELAEAYKSGMRQSDYTKKTMEVAEQRKAADAEIQKAAQERNQYAQELQTHHAVIQAALHEQSKINFDELLANDPVEFLKQKHLYEQRQAAVEKIKQDYQQLTQIQKAEQEKNFNHFVKQQQEELLAKLPEWKDSEKAKAETHQLREFLQGNGFSRDEVESVVDHRHVLLARKAMLYDQMMSKASVAAKKVSTLPQKVEKPGVSESRTMDKRSSAFQRLSKSGKVEDAAAVFASFL